MTAKKKKILLIEDDKVDQMAFKRFADQKDFPFEYRICGSISEGLEALKTEKFDVILSDYFLQDGTAFDILSDISGIPLIVVTGTGNEEIAVKAMKMGAYDYLIKDVEGYYFKVLPVTVGNALNRFEAEQKLQKYYEKLEDEVEKRTRKYKKEILQRKQAKESLKASEEKFRTITEESADAIFITDKEGCYRYVNKAACEMLGYTYNELIRMNIRDLASEETAAASMNEFGQLTKTGRLYSELELKKKDGTLIPTDLNAVVLPDGFIYGSCRNISDRKRAEKQVMDNLREKEILLKEIHHRVKNNLSIIISLLNLQSRRIKSKDQALEAFQVSKDRIYAMSLVHEKLYKAENLSHIDMRGYFESLSNALVGAHSEEKEIRFEIDADDVFLDIDKAIPCCLIINELLTNAIKHAFPDKKTGLIKIRFKRADEKALILSIEDDGIGLPADVEIDQADTLGLQIVRLLTGQLDGFFQIAKADGACISISIPKEANE